MTIEYILKISSILETQLNKRFNNYGLTINQADLLIYFYKYSENKINATNAIEELGIDKRLMSLGLKALESKQYIIRHPNTNDKRQKDIELSLSALEICEDLIAIKEEVNAIFEAQLSSEQINLIKAIEGEI